MLKLNELKQAGKNLNVEMQKQNTNKYATAKHRLIIDDRMRPNSGMDQKLTSLLKVIKLKTKQICNRNDRIWKKSKDIDTKTGKQKIIVGHIEDKADS